MQTTKDLVLSYFNAWQKKTWPQMRACLADAFDFDAGEMQFHSADAFTTFCKQGPGWSQVQLLESIFNDKQAALLYEGITASGQKVRVAEFITLAQGKIGKVKALMTYL